METVTIALISFIALFTIYRIGKAIKDADRKVYQKWIAQVKKMVDSI